MKIKMLLSASLMILSVSASASRGPRTVDVQGYCFREVAPDKGRVDLTHVVLEKDIQTAARVVGERYESLKRRVEGLKLKDLELRTQHYSVQERREWIKERSVFKGYEARMTLQVSSTDLSRMGEVLSAAGQEGVQEVGSLQMFISTARRESERSECLKQAVLDAQSKAQGMAESLKARVGGVLRITEEGAAPYTPPVMADMAAFESMPRSKMMRAGAPQVEAGREELRYSVSVSFELR